MAVKRTGTGWGFLKTFELIGRPFYLLIFYFLSWLSLLFTALGQSVLSLSQIKLPSISWPKLPHWRLPLLKRPSFKLSLVLLFLLFLLVSGWWLYTTFVGLPNPDQLITRDQAVTTKIYDRNGTLLYKIYRNQNRTLVKLQEIPLDLIQATIAIEDAEFYQHHGFSAKGIIRASLRNLRGDKLYGGSTITQQLVKNTLLTPERTWQRKLKEIVLSVWVETKFPKDQILQMYLNEVSYGGAAYGIEEATQMYFGKSIREISLTEAALLAGLPKAPTEYSPFGAYPEKAKKRQVLVLERMRQEGYLTAEQEQKAAEEELNFAPQRTDIAAPHFVMYVKDLLVQLYGTRLVEEGGLEVRTSLDLELQQKAEAIVRQQVDRLEGLLIGNGAALVTQPKNGEILAMVGSKDYFNLDQDGNVNVTLRPRQPGSAIKPVNYSIALENGFTAATIIADTPITYQIPGQPPYSPRNYDNRFHGNVPLRIALASSYNVPAVKVLSAFGVERMVKRGQEMGITTWENPSDYGLSLTLGGGEVKMIDLVVAYATLANLGTRVDLNPILEVKDYQGKTLKHYLPYSPASQSVLSPEVAYLLTDILADNAARTPAFGPSSWLNIKDHPHVAVKTGTTQNLRDNWTIGYTPDYLVAVWVGNNDNSPMSYVASGVTGASPIWNQVMSYLLADLPDQDFPRPEALKEVAICSLTGTLPCEGCPTRTELFAPGTEPTTHCQLQKATPAPDSEEKTGLLHPVRPAQTNQTVWEKIIR